MRIFHADQKIHFNLLRAFKREFTEDTALLRIAEEHLETQCVFCYTLFESKQDRDRHHNTCIIRFSLLCMWYGEPLRTTRAFRSSHSDQSIKDAEMSHAVRAVKKILDSISDTNASTSDQPTIVTGKAHVIGFCSSIILDATKEDFFQESQSSSSTTTDSSDESHSDQAASVRKKKTEEKRRRRRKEQETRHKKRKQKKRKRKKEGRKIEETDEEDKHTDGSGSGSGSGSDDEDEGRITEKIKSINIKSNHRHKIILKPMEMTKERTIPINFHELTSLAHRKTLTHHQVMSLE